MTVELVCVGTEILLGNIVNTNAAYLAEQCAGSFLAFGLEIFGGPLVAYGGWYAIVLAFLRAELCVCLLGAVAAAKANLSFGGDGRLLGKPD